MGSARCCMRIIAIVSITFLLLLGRCSAQEKFDVFFVAVGSGSYIAPPKAVGISDLKGLPPIPGAAKSAELVAELLQRGGTSFGVKLVSDETHFVGRDDIVNAISRVFHEIAKTQPRHPLVVFYFAGHGVADGMTWDHYSLPGNFLYRGDLSVAVGPQWSGAAANLSLHAATLVAWFLDARMPFLVILDTVVKRPHSDGIASSGASPVRSIGRIIHSTNAISSLDRVYFA